MLHQIREKQITIVRRLLVYGWLILILSLLFDPISHHLTEPSTHWSIFRLHPHLLDPEKCHEIVTVQGKCLEEQTYPLGARIFWGMVPWIIFMVFIFGHDLWRRICPLSFFSQLPKNLGIQRKNRVFKPNTGKIRYELVKISKNSWLGRYHLYFQFGFLYTGLCLRILFFDSHRLLLASFLLLTILAAITIGYLFAGKSWCQYFCPMGVVEMFYIGPRALLGSEAHQNSRRKITQSMCRTVDLQGKVKSACVGCQSSCMDIDAEKSYWDSLNKPGRKFFHYGYVGLVLGFYLYYFFYSGTLSYYYSSAWTHQENQLNTLLSPGFYLFNQPIPIPKLIAVPLTLAWFVLCSYYLFCRLEKLYKVYSLRAGRPLTTEQVRHHLFSLCSLITINIVFFFGIRVNTKIFSTFCQYLIAALMIILSSFWFYRTQKRSAQLYAQERLAPVHGIQKSKLKPTDKGRFLTFPEDKTRKRG